MMNILATLAQHQLLTHANFVVFNAGTDKKGLELSLYIFSIWETAAEFLTLMQAPKLGFFKGLSNKKKVT